MSPSSLTSLGGKILEDLTIIKYSQNTNIIKQKTSPSNKSIQNNQSVEHENDDYAG